MKCPRGHNNPSGNKFCEICGDPITPQKFLDISWSQINWPFVWRWVAMNILAIVLYLVAVAIVSAITFEIFYNAISDYASGLMGGLLGGYGGYGGYSGSGTGAVMLGWLLLLVFIALYGFLVGWAQNTLVQRIFPYVKWISYSTLGAFAATVGVYILARIGLRSPFFLLLGLAAAFSAVQWLVLRSQVKDAWIWIAGNVAAAVVLWIFSPLITAIGASTLYGGGLDALYYGDTSGMLLGLLIPTLIFGVMVTIVTGITMNYVFQRK